MTPEERADQIMGVDSTIASPELRDEIAATIRAAVAEEREACANEEVIARAIHEVVYGGHDLETCPEFRDGTLGGTAKAAAVKVAAAIRARP